MNQILYLDGVSVSFDGFKALSNLSFYIDDTEVTAFKKYFGSDEI